MVATIPENRENELINNALAELRSKTDISQLTPGAKARSLLEIVMRETSNSYTYFNQKLIQAFVRYAVGKNLDLIGELLGVSRLPATRADVTSAVQVQKFFVDGGGVFGTVNSNVSFVIPAGTEVYSRVGATGQAIVYVLTAAVTCAPAVTEAYGAIRSVEFGTDSNVGAGTLVLHNFENYVDYLSDTLKTTNIDGIIEARDEELDDNYRYRITNQTVAAEAANSTAIRMAALSIPGVSDAYLDEFAMGIGTGYVYVEAVVVPATEQLIASVGAAIRQVKATGCNIVARSPKLSGIEIAVTLNLYKDLPADEEEDLKLRVRDIIYDYVNNLNIGQAFESSRIINEILGVDKNIKRLGTLTQPIDELYIWKYSASDDTRIPNNIIEDYQPATFERVIIEFGEVAGGNPIRITAKKDTGGSIG